MAIKLLQLNRVDITKDREQHINDGRLDQLTRNNELILRIE